MQMPARRLGSKRLDLSILCAVGASTAALACGSSDLATTAGAAGAGIAGNAGAIGGLGGFSAAAGNAGSSAQAGKSAGGDAAGDSGAGACLPAEQPVESDDPTTLPASVRSLSGQPCVYEEIWLPPGLLGALAEGDISTWGDLLYPLFAERCGVYVHRAVDEIAFGALTATQARHLNLPAGHPCAKVSRNAYDLSGQCVEVRFTRGDAHAFHYTVALT